MPSRLPPQRPTLYRTHPELILNLGSCLAVLAIVAIYGLEVLVALIQAYVFTILTCVYLKDALHPGH